LAQILDEIAAESPQGARHVQKRIKTIIDLLPHYPQSGKATSLSGLRRIVATPYPYLVFYKATDAEIIIIAVRHGARDPRSMPDQS
jgi:toxin ParE1/3/4